ncbi:hypothetical protein ACJX0J_013372, partial [Zea mays]
TKFARGLLTIVQYNFHPADAEEEIHINAELGASNCILFIFMVIHYFGISETLTNVQILKFIGLTLSDVLHARCHGLLFTTSVLSIHISSIIISVSVSHIKLKEVHFVETSDTSVAEVLFLGITSEEKFFGKYFTQITEWDFADGKFEEKEILRCQHIGAFIFMHIISMILFGLPTHFFALDEDVTNNSNFFKEKLTQALRESTAYYITCITLSLVDQWATEKKQILSIDDEKRS